MTTINPHPDSLAIHFQQFSSCEVADSVYALSKRNLTVGNLTQRSGDSTRSIAGPVYTVQYAPKSDPTPAVEPHYIDQAPRGSVILINGAEELACGALFGGLMSTRASYIGCQGTVVLGNVRDLSEHRKLNYPVYSTGVAVAAASAMGKVVAVNEPLRLAGFDVSAGDWLVADENGAAFIPSDLVVQVAEDIVTRSKADALAALDIESGKRAAESIKARRAEIPKH